MLFPINLYCSYHIHVLLETLLNENLMIRTNNHIFYEFKLKLGFRRIMQTSLFTSVGEK